MASPSEKSERYDRQLRLWGDHGQTALESSHVCLINASATGTEILKNLVLAGVGSFSILDNQCVSEADLGNNFFLSADAIGSSRGACAKSLLQELNSDVRCSAIEEDFDSIMTTDTDFFKQFAVVIATELPEARLLKLGGVLWESKVPLLIARSYGFLGYLRLAAVNHEIVESHPDSYHEDVRLDCPFPGLIQHMDTYDLDTLENSKHTDVPYLVILYKHLQQWKEGHDGELPKNYREKKELKEMIRRGIRKNDKGVPMDEENFDEAIQNVNSLVIPTSIPKEVQEIFDNALCTYITPDSNNFWLLAKAVKEFVANEGEGQLPLRGSIPDMTSSSDMYIDLQRVYQARARRDVESVAGHLSQILISMGRPSNSISMGEIKKFCHNSSFLRQVCFRSLSEEYSSPKVEEFHWQLESSNCDLVYYILLRAADRFYKLHKFYPGEKEGSMESDISELKGIVLNLLQCWGLPLSSVSDEHMMEFCRYGGAELHSIAAFLGGVAAQEVIKMVTHQFVPFNNTFLYNAAMSRTVTVAV